MKVVRLVGGVRMKRFTTIVMVIFLLGVLSVNMFIEKRATLAKVENSEEQQELIEDIANKIIRFHVIANSDTEKDQNLKLKVRDAVLQYVRPLLEDSDDINQSREILKAEDKNIIAIANKVIRDNGYKYSVESTLTREYFPIKTYGNITLPQGQYEAYRIIIGSGEGHNWWCVMFPPICFVDITKGEVAYEETENEMGRVLDDKEMNLIDNKIADSKEEDDKKEDSKKEDSKIKDSKIVDNSEDNNIVVKFKIVEVFKKLFR